MSRFITLSTMLAVSSMTGFATSIQDNFDGPGIDPAKWDLFAEGGNLTVNSGRLNYIRSGTPTSDDFAVLEFIATEPGYEETWEVIVDVANTAARTNPTNQYTGAGISILDLEHDETWNEVFLELGNEFLPDFAFFSNFITDDVDIPGSDAVLAAGTSGSLRISYNGGTKVFSIWVDPSGSADGFQWQLLSSYGIAGSGGIRNTDWEMTADGTFLISLYGLSARLVVSTGNVTFDNFRFNSGAGTPPVGPAELVAPKIALVGGTVLLTLDSTVAGRRYQAQQSTTLASPDWQNVGEEKTGAGTALAFTVPRDPLVPRRFYRIALDPVSP
jgi:hypothetical protein